MKKSLKWGFAIALACALLATGWLVFSKLAVSDLKTGGWIQQRMERLLPAYRQDFVLNEAYIYTEDTGKPTMSYASNSDIEDVRQHYEKLLKDIEETGVNNEGNLNVTGVADGKKVSIRNYFSEVTNIIDVTLEDNDPKLRAKALELFPEQAFTAKEQFKDVIKGESNSGYVLFSYDEYDVRFSAGVPIYSRAYAVSEPATKTQTMDQGALLIMEPHEINGKQMAVLIYQAKNAEGA